MAMSVRYRSLLAEDVPDLVAQVAAHPILGLRYGSSTDDFGAAVSRTLGRSYEVACAFEEVDRSSTRLLGAGIVVFVKTEFLNEIKTTPGFWVGPQLVSRILRGPSPLLSDKEVRDANSSTGLNLLVWHMTIHPNDLTHPEVGVAVMNAFLANFLGFQVNEILTQGDCLAHVQASRNMGCRYLDPLTGSYGDFPELNDDNFGDEPHYLGLQRQSVYNLGLLWSLFCCPAARIGFSPSEQRMLRSALDGRTDEDVSRQLNISLTAVRKSWRGVYGRAAEHLPILFADRPPRDVSMHERGKERRRRLLAYLRDHPEELRPVSRILLRRGHAASGR
jgi:hypothetical protein